jgi:mRNA-degrading endonuclease RelE of RelBE toxin-antitoxin system
MFVLVFAKSARADLIFLNSKQENLIRKKIQILKTNPFPVGKNPKRLQGTSSYRLRAGDYRIIYEVNENEVNIYKISHRKDAYRL